MGFPGGSDSKESACNKGDLDSIPGLGRSPGGGHGNLLKLPGESPWTEDPGGLQSMGSQRAEHNRATKHSIAQPQNGGFPGGSVAKNPPAKAGDVGLIPDQEGPLEKKNGNSLQYCSLGNSMDCIEFHGLSQRVRHD